MGVVEEKTIKYVQRGKLGVCLSLYGDSASVDTE